MFIVLILWGGFFGAVIINVGNMLYSSDNLHMFYNKFKNFFIRAGAVVLACNFFSFSKCQNRGGRPPFKTYPTPLNNNLHNFGKAIEIIPNFFYLPPRSEVANITPTQSYNFFRKNVPVVIKKQYPTLQKNHLFTIFKSVDHFPISKQYHENEFYLVMTATTCFKRLLGKGVHFKTWYN